MRKARERAACVLPAEVAMAIECASEEETSPEWAARLAALLRHVISCGLEKKPLRPGGEERVCGDTLLLTECVSLALQKGADVPAELAELARGLPRADWFPLVAAVGFGGTPEAAEELAYVALKRPKDTPNADGRLAAFEGRCLQGLNAAFAGERRFSALAVSAESDGGGCVHLLLSSWAARRARI